MIEACVNGFMYCVFCKQKTAYEMRISYGSSDVCSSDLENLQRNAIALLPTRPRKKLTVDILQAIEREISRYVLTITLINTALGMILAGALYWLGVELPEALLWGTLAALLNFAPYVGPLVGVVLMLLMGFITYDEIGPSPLPARSDERRVGKEGVS